jgi:hypothetical protein
MLSFLLCSLAAASPVILVGPSGLIHTGTSDVATPLLEAMGLNAPIIEKNSNNDVVRRYYYPGCYNPDWNPRR